MLDGIGTHVMKWSSLHFVEFAIVAIRSKLKLKRFRARIGETTFRNHAEKNFDRTDGSSSPRKSNGSANYYLVMEGGNYTDIKGDYFQVNYYGVDRRKSVIEWLSPLNHISTYEGLLEKRAQHTGEWLLKSNQYLDWCSGDRYPDKRILWCPGIPGAGKTVMASLVTSHLRQKLSRRATVCCIFFNYRFENEQDITTVLRAISRQLYESQQTPIPEFDDLYESHNNGQLSPDPERLRTALAMAFSRLQFEEVYIVLDALDEYSKPQNLVSKLQELMSTLLSLGGAIRLFATSRMLGAVKELMVEFGAFEQEICTLDSDIKLYVKNRTADIAIGLSAKISADLESKIVDRVIECARGSFLMAELHMNTLCDQPSVGDVKEALGTLSASVNQTYAQTLERIKLQTVPHKKLALRAITWILHGVRPLTARELEHALATKDNRSNIEEFVVPISRITSYCAGIVVVRPGPHKEDIVSFVHFTAQEFFASKHCTIGLSHSPSEELGKTCLDYLSLDSFNHVPLMKGQQHCIQKMDSHRRSHEARRHHHRVHETRFEYPLLHYAVSHWGTHASKCPGLSERVMTFLTQENQGKMLIWEYTLSILPSFPPFFRSTSPIEVAILLAIYHHQNQALPELLEAATASHLNSVLPLHFAAAVGTVETVEIILGHLAVDIDAPDALGRTAVSWAVENVNNSVLEALFRQAAHPDIKDVGGRTPLSHACALGNAPAVDILLLRGADCNSQDEKGQTPLIWARSSSSTGPVHPHWDVNAVIKLLLDKSALIAQMTESGGRVPLYRNETKLPTPIQSTPLYSSPFPYVLTTSTYCPESCQFATDGDGGS